VGGRIAPMDDVVHIPTYVMLELGQPLHAYDRRRLRGGALVARQARRGESLRTLDSLDRVLPEGTLVIADAERALGIAGILGGEDSEIREDTTTVALECASFEPRGIGRTATKLGLQGSSGRGRSCAPTSRSPRTSSRRSVASLDTTVSQRGFPTGRCRSRSGTGWKSFANGPATVSLDSVFRRSCRTRSSTRPGWCG